MPICECRRHEASGTCRRSSPVSIRGSYCSQHCDLLHKPEPWKNSAHELADRRQLPTSRPKRRAFDLGGGGGAARTQLHRVPLPVSPCHALPTTILARCLPMLAGTPLTAAATSGDRPL